MPINPASIFWFSSTQTLIYVTPYVPYVYKHDNWETIYVCRLCYLSSLKSTKGMMFIYFMCMPCLKSLHITHHSWENLYANRHCTWIYHCGSDFPGSLCHFTAKCGRTGWGQTNTAVHQLVRDHCEGSWRQLTHAWWVARWGVKVQGVVQGDTSFQWRQICTQVLHTLWWMHPLDAQPCIPLLWIQSYGGARYGTVRLIGR